MSYPKKDIGKRIKSGQDLTMYYRFPPGSGQKPEVQTLPAGKPSPIITGYIPKGFYVVEGGSGGSYYIKDSDSIEVVSKDASDNSGWFSGVFSSTGDFWENTTDDVSRYSGYLSEGFSDSVSGVFGGTKKILIAVAVLIGLMLLFRILEMFE